MTHDVRAIRCKTKMKQKERDRQRKGASDQINFNILCQKQEKTGFFFTIINVIFSICYFKYFIILPLFANYDLWYLCIFLLKLQILAIDIHIIFSRLQNSNLVLNIINGVILCGIAIYVYFQLRGKCAYFLYFCAHCTHDMHVEFLLPER